MLMSRQIKDWNGDRSMEHPYIKALSKYGHDVATTEVNNFVTSCWKIKLLLP